MKFHALYQRGQTVKCGHLILVVLDVEGVLDREDDLDVLERVPPGFLAPDHLLVRSHGTLQHSRENCTDLVVDSAIQLLRFPPARW